VRRITSRKWRIVSAICSFALRGIALEHVEALLLRRVEVRRRLATPAVVSDLHDDPLRRRVEDLDRRAVALQHLPHAATVPQG
jgi:hypothetical protein